MPIRIINRHISRCRKSCTSFPLDAPDRTGSAATPTRRAFSPTQAARAVCLVPMLLLARTAAAVISIGAGRDVVYAPGAHALFLNYRPQAQHLVYFAGGWRGQYHDEFYGAGYHCGYGRLSLSFGITYVTDETAINGTHWNFATHIAYLLGRHWALGYRHISNGNFMFHWDNRPNLGWNFLGIDYRFDVGSGKAQRTCLPRQW